MTDMKTLKSIIAPILISLLAITPLKAQVKTQEVNILSGECWWGGLDNPHACPLTENGGHYTFPMDENTDAAMDFNKESYNNNCVPFFVSTAGRYIWSDEPLKAVFKEGVIKLESAGKIQLVCAGTNLKEAYLAASAAHFPPSGKIPPEEFITCPQYNTWIELMYDQNQADILKYAHAIADNGFPTGAVLMVDDNWQKYYGNYEFKPEKFPDPKAMMDELHSLGFRVMLWVSPFVSPDSPEYRELAKKGYLVMDAVKDQPVIDKWWNGFSAIIDISNPEARGWMVSKLKEMQEKFGVDGFKFDAGDAHSYTQDKIKVHDGKSYGPKHTELWCRMYEEFPYNELRASWKLAGEPIVMRLCDKLADWEAVRGLVPAMLAAGMEGHLFTCPDMIGGGAYTSFLDVDPADIDQEQIVRSCQIHAMMPMMQFSVAPWRILSKENMEICRAAAWKHVEMAPYLIEKAKEGAINGAPVARPMEFEFPGQGFEGCNDQYMLGEKYLIAPMLEPGTVRTVKLPKGRWQDETGRKYKGGKTYDIEVPMDRIPVFTQVK